MLKVKNVLGTDFDLCCEELGKQIKNQGFSPNLIIGVLTGGGYVGHNLYNYFRKDNPHLLYKETKLQRGSTKLKSKSNIKIILKQLPYTILNIIRILEVEILELKAKFITPSRYGTLKLDSETIKFLKEGNKNVLIVDDCIDTGMTLKIIKDYISKEFNESNNIKLAVITTAHRHPIITADFSLYNRVLIRFPWAYDTKSNCH